ncbi:conserved protein of unknown function [Maridesulfovibrio hydrothermalis AM13 = DSM 14728]|uniref:DUF2065 domain-containing protein n=2 Tax=Maridesulfovibrio TaxID=2794998 RepID=L0RA53_9BACT|nr:conserved protein of unknown function [Maridesulfovibrio hydrothermalis AM13 = DSM 14728]
MDIINQRIYIATIMNIEWSFLLSALGLAFIIEGIPYFLFSERMPRILISIIERGPKQLRILGLIAMIFGLLLISFGQSLSDL